MRSISPSSPGISATAMCRRRSSTDCVCASSRIPCWRRCWVSSAPRCAGSRRPSRRKAAPMRSSASIPMRIDAHSPGGDAGESGLLLLQAWLSPAFPVGGYSYSHGLEYAVEAGFLPDRNALRNWIEGILLFGAGRNDALLIREIHRAVTAQEFERCDEVAGFAAALRGTSELALEASAQGAAFLKALRAGWPELMAVEPLHQWGRPVYAVAFGAAA